MRKSVKSYVMSGRYTAMFVTIMLRLIVPSELTAIRKSNMIASKRSITIVKAVYADGLEFNVVEHAEMPYMMSDDIVRAKMLSACTIDAAGNVRPGVKTVTDVRIRASIISLLLVALATLTNCVLGYAGSKVNVSTGTESTLHKAYLVTLTLAVLATASVAVALLTLYEPMALHLSGIKTEDVISIGGSVAFKDSKGLAKYLKVNHSNIQTVLLNDRRLAKSILSCDQDSFACMYGDDLIGSLKMSSPVPSSLAALYGWHLVADDAGSTVGVLYNFQRRTSRNAYLNRNGIWHVYGPESISVTLPKYVGNYIVRHALIGVIGDTENSDSDLINAVSNKLSVISDLDTEVTKTVKYMQSRRYNKLVIESANIKYELLIAYLVDVWHNSIEYYDIRALVATLVYRIATSNVVKGRLVSKTLQRRKAAVNKLRDRDSRNIVEDEARAKINSDITEVVKDQVRNSPVGQVMPQKKPRHPSLSAKIRRVAMHKRTPYRRTPGDYPSYNPTNVTMSNADFTYMQLYMLAIKALANEYHVATAMIILSSYGRKRKKVPMLKSYKGVRKK